jgi:porin
MAAKLDAEKREEDPLKGEDRRATGDWGGLRSSLNERGLTPFVSYTTGFWSNLTGGLDTGVRYLGFADWGLDADLETLADWRGGGFHINWQSYHGGQPSERLVGSYSLGNVSGLEAQECIRFFEIFLEQRAFGDRLRAKIGQLTLDQDFMISEHAQLFRNAVFGDYVTGASTADVAVYPVAAPGFYLEAEPWPDWQIRAGVYTGDPGNDGQDNYGFDRSFSNRRGATIFGEIVTKRPPFGLQGSYAVGVGGQTGHLQNFEDGGESDGAQVFYASIDQTLYDAQRVSGEAHFELGAFLRVSVPVQSDRAVIDWQINCGLELRQAVPGRPADSTGLGFAYFNFGREYLRSVQSGGVRVENSEALLELTYRTAVTRWLWLQPDLQYFIHPHLGRRDAVAFGWSAVVEL